MNTNSASETNEREINLNTSLRKLQGHQRPKYRRCYRKIIRNCIRAVYCLPPPPPPLLLQLLVRARAARITISIVSSFDSSSAAAVLPYWWRQDYKKNREEYKYTFMTQQMKDWPKLVKKFLLKNI
ncbi:unnamed protein product [Trichogramma brassicae]|uniref:Uncharacterized protein n=1 Tax=Trichogramma brassicae TaxID=86971 RepID=A0A6H5HVX2_9HYME|nr:unnamed protein product [Trichogramma brassicae]